MGDVSDFRNFMGAVIDGSSFETQSAAIEEAKADKETSIVVGGGYSDTQGWFVEPTVIETRNPEFRTMREELFGPVVTTYVYDETNGTTRSADRPVRAVRPHRRRVLGGPRRDRRCKTKLRYAAGNFYVNDKPTGAVVGQQPFGGARASGTNDKAGSMWNLIRWVSPRSIKETFTPPRDYRYPFMEDELGDRERPGERGRVRRRARVRDRGVASRPEAASSPLHRPFRASG